MCDKQDLLAAQAEIASLRSTVRELSEWIRMHGNVPKYGTKKQKRICIDFGVGNGVVGGVAPIAAPSGLAEFGIGEELWQ